MARRTLTLSTLVACTTSFVALLIYSITLYQTVPGGDSGELITVAHVWGVAHPPGYPLYTLLAHFFSLLPFGSLAWRVGLFSAVCDAGAAGLLAAAVIGFRQSRFYLWAGVFAGLLFAFSPEVWKYATQAEVFPLNNLCIAAVLYFSVRYNATQNSRTLYFISFIAGLGTFHQQTFIFISVPLLVFLWIGKSRKQILICAAIFSLGFLPYLLLPLSASWHPVMSWGEPETLRGFLIHLLRREYGTFRLGSSAWNSTHSGLDHLLLYFRSIPAQFLGVLFIFSIPGVWISGRNSRWLVASFFSYLFIFAFLSNSMLEIPLHRAVEARFWQQTDFILYFWCGLGFAWAFEHISTRARTFTSAWAPALVTLLVVAVQCTFYFKQSDQSQNHVIEDYARSILENLEPGSVLIVTSDVAWNATQYLQLCEKFRTDVRVVSQEMMTYVWMTEKMKFRYPDLVFPGSYYLPDKETRSSFVTRYDERYASGGYSMLEFLNANSRKPIYLSYSFRESSVLNQYQLIPIGLYDRVVRLQNSGPLDQKELIARSNAFWAHFDGSPALQAAEGSWEHFIGQMVQLYRVRHELSASK